MGDDRGPVDADRMGEQQLSVESGRVSEPAARRRSVPASTRVRVAVIGAASESDGDGDFADLAQDLGAGRASPAVEKQVDRGVPDAQIGQGDLAEPPGQVQVAPSSAAAWARKPSMVSRKRNDEPAAHACGEHATG